MVLLLIASLLFAHVDIGIEKHFKKVENKTDISTMRNIDYIYLINLDKRPEKYERTKEALKSYGITPYRFAAVNGWDLSFEAIDDLGANYQPGSPPGPLCTVYRHVDGKEYHSFEIMQEEGVAYYSHTLSRGNIGCVMSHLSVLQDAYDTGYNTIWIMEDDVRVVSDPREISSLIDTLDRLVPDWDVFFTDDEIKGGDGDRSFCGGVRPRPNFPSQSLAYYIQRSYLTNDIIKLGIRFGSHSMVLRRSGMKKILDFFKTYKLFFPYDMDYFLPPGIKLYGCTRDIVTNIAGGVSDNGNPNYQDE